MTRLLTRFRLISFQQLPGMLGLGRARSSLCCWQLSSASCFPSSALLGVEERQGKPACCSSYGTAQHLPKDLHLPEGSRAFGVGKPHGRGPSSALGSGWRGRCEVASKRC